MKQVKPRNHFGEAGEAGGKRGLTFNSGGDDAAVQGGNVDVEFSWGGGGRWSYWIEYYGCNGFGCQCWVTDGPQVALLPPPKRRREQMKNGVAVLIWGMGRVFEWIKREVGKVIIWILGEPVRLVWDIIRGKWAEKPEQSPPEHHHQHEPTSTTPSLRETSLPAIIRQRPSSLLLRDPLPYQHQPQMDPQPASLTESFPPQIYSQLPFSTQSAAENVSELIHTKHPRPLPLLILSHGPNLP
ncbi:hypothetical protein EV426DRAFT_702584 [Tirmania nivea]|nr:hypothetical protein EV426DRAFT_702584 [Tirmania nivea]